MPLATPDGPGESNTMRVVHSLAEISSSAPSVVTIGNFDGVHRGHRSILEAVGERAVRLGARAVAVTFDPHPLRQVAPERAPVPLSTLEQKIELISASPIDVLLVQKFDAEFQRLSPEAFIERFLVDGLQARCVCVGKNFRFGHRHGGNPDTLRRWADAIEVVEVPPVLDRGRTISSSAIRSLLVGDGDAGRSRRMLGRCYEIEGRVVAGTGRGRELTVPTLNIESRNALIPARGVYLTRISVDGGEYRDSLTNVGVRPTFDGEDGAPRRTIETYVLDAAIEAGAVTERLKFVKRLRDEQRFGGPGELRAQIGRDMDFARRFFRRMDRIRFEGAVGCAANDGVEGTVRVTMFSRPGCHLCDSAADVIHDVRRRREFQFEVVNIEDDPALESRYGTRIPVIHIDGNPAFTYRVDARSFEEALERLCNK